ncbi:MAG: hypothetical protein PHY09_17070 [Desulfuromonadaceae bacterium]|nr:hypothetical protein [Desulfuromonadaceae bacterium]MDD5106151.1 hypothetical protein [Desulfuromonadaceae bacterium]
MNFGVSRYFELLRPKPFLRVGGSNLLGTIDRSLHPFRFRGQDQVGADASFDRVGGVAPFNFGEYGGFGVADDPQYF